MPKQLTSEDFKESLNAHVASRGGEIFQQYGPNIGWTELLAILADRACCRYPCKIVFDADGLMEGEFAHPRPDGNSPEEGFRMQVHPYFMTQLDRVPHLVLYQLVLVNYGEFASADDAETFGAAALGLERDAYYQMLCEMADCIAVDAASAV
jgi:hypothetical protein